MADEVNRLVNEIDVQEAEGARTRANSFQSFLKKKFGKPDGFSPRISATIDKVSINDTTKTFKQLTKNWDNIRKHTHTGLFKFGFMKDKREMTDINKFFGKLEIKAMEAIRKYNEQLKALESNNTKTGAIDTINKKLDLYERKLERIKKIEEHWTNEKSHWEDVQNSLSGTDTLEQVKGRRTKLQAEKNKISNELKKKQDKAFSSQRNQNNIQSGIQDASARFDLAANKAAAVKWQFGKDGTGDKVDPNYNWKRITDYVKSMNEDNATKRDELEQLQAEMVDEEHTLYSLYNKAKEEFKENGTEANKTFVDTVKNDLDTLRINLQGVESQLDQLAIKEKLAQAYQKSINKARATKGADHASWKAGGDDLNRSAGWDFAQAGKMEKAVFNNIVEDTIPDQYLDGLKQKRAEIQKEIDGLNDDMAQARINDKAKLDAKQHIEEADSKLKKAADMTDATTKATTNWNNELAKTNDEIQHIHEQLQLVLNDMKINPIQVEMKADALQPLNHEADELNRKWGVMGSLVDKIKAKLNGVKGYMRQINPLSKLWHKMVLNTYSQIASFLNPLNIIKRSMSSFLDRFDNKDWANTFDVIKYNLVTAIAPILEKILMIGLKLAAVANVFTKKWAGVDLFDKAAWETEQMKKNVGAMTASFDELHSSTENPNALNTVFDTGKVNKDDLISPELEAKLGEWADKLANIFGTVKKAWDGMWSWIKKHPVLAAIGAITLAALLSKLGLGGLLTALGGWLFKGLKGVVKLGWEGIKWLGPKILSGLKWVGEKVTEYAPKIWNGMKTAASKAGTAISNFLNKGLYTGMDGATVTMGKFIGGVALVGGGVALAGTQAAKAGKNWQDYNKWQKAGAIGAVGLGSAMAGIGAVMLGASGPVGWAIGGAVALGALCIGMAQTQNGIGSLKKETEEWETAQQNLQIAVENTQNKLDTYNGIMYDVKTLEEETGKSGEDLANAIANGSLSIDDLSAKELQLYNAYINSRQALTELTSARKEEFKAAQTEAKEKADMLFKLGEEQKSYDDLADHIKTCWENGTMDTATARDLMSRYMADMSESERQAFVEQMPAHLQEGLNPEKYASGFQKFGTWVGEQFTAWVDKWKTILGMNTNEMEQYKGTVDDLISAEETLQAAMEKKNEIQAELSELETKAGITADELRTKIANGEIAYNSLTEAQKALIAKDNEYKNTQSEVQKALDVTGEHVAGLAYQELKQTGDYKTFITTLKQQNEQGNISAEKMNHTFGEVMSDMSTSEQRTFKQYMKDMGLSTAEAEKQCQQSQTAFQKWYSALSGFFQDIGQKFKNLFSGNGFKTDIQVNANASVSGQSVASLDVGTNYVPNDGLAYIHKGEAVVPAKYNKPYRDTGTSNETNATLNDLKNEINRLSEVVNQGIKVTGEFRQRGNDLVATVEKVSGKNSNNVLNNKVYAR